jgi:hypothetical protein
VTATDLLVAGLAARAALAAWFDEDSVLATARAWTQTWRWELASTLANCPFCLSYWVAGGSVALYVFAPELLPPGWSAAARLPVQALAAAGVVDLLRRLDRPPPGAPDG